jgi:hypothetical protein
MVHWLNAHETSWDEVGDDMLLWMEFKTPCTDKKSAIREHLKDTSKPNEVKPRHFFATPPQSEHLPIYGFILTAQYTIKVRLCLVPEACSPKLVWNLATPSVGCKV